MSVPAGSDIEDCRGKSWSSADGDLSVSHRSQRELAAWFPIAVDQRVGVLWVIVASTPSGG
jgi:hypothetical protein